MFALVTGSSGGLGLEICQYLLDSGYTVFGVSRTESDLDDSNFIDISCDLRDEEAVEEMFEAIGEECEGLNLIVNCAGIFEMYANKKRLFLNIDLLLNSRFHKLCSVIISHLLKEFSVSF